MSSVLPPNTAPVKPEFLLSINPASISAPDDDAAEGSSNHPSRDPNIASSDSRGDSRSGRGGRGRGRGGKQSKEEKKAARGSNKGRRFGKVRDEVDLCRRIAVGEVCEHGDECRQPHDVAVYLAAKLSDIRIPRTSEISDFAPFVAVPATVAQDVEMAEPISLETSTEVPQPEIAAPQVEVAAPQPEVPAPAPRVQATICPDYEERGQCRFGLKCRFLSAHCTPGPDGTPISSRDEAKIANSAVSAKEVNYVTAESLRLLRTRKYPLPISSAYLKELEVINANHDANQGKASAPAPIPEPPTDNAVVVMAEPEQDDGGESGSAPQVLAEPQQPENLTVIPTNGDSAEKDTPDVPVRFEEKKRLDWKGKTYLAPLTTVGNLPFRRLCVSYGADITCGEMGLATSFLQGSKEEWSLVRRHPSEKIFGAQICGNKPSSLVPAAEAIAREAGGNIDFVDVNCGCPIDLVFNSGSGSALLDSPGKLGKILTGMSKALGEIPVTVKLRTGIKEGKNTAHKLMPRLATEFGASCLTLHGRTRQQRYTKLADWDYIKECVSAVRARETDFDLPPVPIFGGGDCFSSQDYWERVEGTGVDGIMVGRGALIKPWIFTEIKERREWDISATERLDLVRQYAEYGISHFGTDTAGIQTARRYLCEALSFQYRYVPIGLLERLPGKLNDRAPSFKGRNELETLLASGDSRDWVKISEMFLGPAPEMWSFTPKHKSNAYESQNQG